MTIDEAIIQFKEDAEYNRADLDLEWAEENEQVARWLEELKAIKESIIFYSNRPIEDIVLEVRADAIDECIKEIDKMFVYTDSRGNDRYASYSQINRNSIHSILEQLKEQNNG